MPSLRFRSGYVRVHHFDDDFYRQAPYGRDMECEA